MLILNLTREAAVLETSDGPVRVFLLERGRVGIDAPKSVTIYRTAVTEQKGQARDKH